MPVLYRGQRVLHCCSHHVAQPHSVVVGIVLHQRVVMCGEERAATDLLGQLLHDSAGNGRAVICGCAPSCKQFTAEWLRATKINRAEQNYLCRPLLLGKWRSGQQQTYPIHPGAQGSAWWRGAGCWQSRSAPQRKCSRLVKTRWIIQA